MKKILITTSSFNLAAQQKKIDCLVQQGYQIITNPYGRRCTEEQILHLLDESVVGMIAGVESLNRAILSNAHNLRVISRCGVGMDNIDLSATNDFGIKVYNTPQAPINAVAELTLCLMLCLLRKVVSNHRDMQLNIWNPVMGNLLCEQIVGIIGYGRIGQRVAQLIRSFGGRVLVYDVNPNCKDECVDLAYLLENATMISLHIPGNIENNHLINQAVIQQMKPGVFLVNTSRGSLIDESALCAALRLGHIAGAALDVFEKEPYDGPLSTLSNVILTSHIGSYAIESRQQMETEAINNLILGLERMSDTERSLVV